MNANGSNQRQITFNALDDEYPAWSPDGRIVFARDFIPILGEADYDILTMNGDGTNQKNLTNTPGVDEIEPSWSPTGRSIAFISYRDGDGELYTMRPNGSGIRQLTFDGLGYEFPDWSPDGRLIAFHSGPVDEFDLYDVYTIRANGGDQTRLTFGAGFDGFPAWSPNGRRLAFMSGAIGSTTATSSPCAPTGAARRTGRTTRRSTSRPTGSHSRTTTRTTTATTTEALSEGGPDRLRALLAASFRAVVARLRQTARSSFRARASVAESRRQTLAHGARRIQGSPRGRSLRCTCLSTHARVGG